jgi:hypothetical protein
MSKQKARKPDRAAKGPAPTNTKVVKVKFEFFREFCGEIVLTVPKKTSKAELVEILETIEVDHTFDDFAWDNEYNKPNSVTVLECETIEGDKADVNFVATGDGDQWKVEEVTAQ